MGTQDKKEALKVLEILVNALSLALWNRVADISCAPSNQPDVKYDSEDWDRWQDDLDLTNFGNTKGSWVSCLNFSLSRSLVSFKIFNGIYFSCHVFLTRFSIFTNEKWAYFEKNTNFKGLRSFYRSFHFPHDLEESFTSVWDMSCATPGWNTVQR